MTNSETKNFSQNVSSSYHLGGECSDEYKKDSLNVPKLRFEGYNEEWVEKSFFYNSGLKPPQDNLSTEKTKRQLRHKMEDILFWQQVEKLDAQILFYGINLVF